VSAIVHDFEHTGTTNNFHMQTRLDISLFDGKITIYLNCFLLLSSLALNYLIRSDIALVYNDRAILENYHISATFRLMLNDSYNILQELTREEYK
jgi:calcium/calmodulin-dependent 3',5'-cyclic nucleotide phosphodiesterase